MCHRYRTTGRGCCTCNARAQATATLTPAASATEEMHQAVDNCHAIAAGLPYQQEGLSRTVRSRDIKYRVFGGVPNDIWILMSMPVQLRLTSQVANTVETGSSQLPLCQSLCVMSDHRLNGSRGKVCYYLFLRGLCPLGLWSTSSLCQLADPRTPCCVTHPIRTGCLQELDLD